MAEQLKMKRVCSTRLTNHDNHFQSFEQTHIMLCARRHVQIHPTGGSFWQASLPLSLSWSTPWLQSWSDNALMWEIWFSYMRHKYVLTGIIKIINYLMGEILLYNPTEPR